MPLSFDDLVPQGGSDTSPPADVAGFEDLIPRQTQGDGPVRLLTDPAFKMAGGLAGGTGMVLEGADRMGSLIDRHVMNPILSRLGLNPLPENKDNPLTQGAALARRAEKAAQPYISQTAQQAEQASTPTGDITQPSTWSLGTNPSMRGYIQQGANLVGQMFPIIFAGRGLGYGGAAAAGGLQTGGGAIEQVNQALDKMFQDGTIEKESKVYADLLASGKSPQEALAETKRQATDLAFIFATPIGAVGGAATNRILHPLTGGLAARPLATRIAVKGGLGALEEGTQEVAESMAGTAGMNVGAGTSQSLTEGTFGDFLLGAMAGGATGSYGARRGSANTPASDQQIGDILGNQTPPPPATPPGAPAAEVDPNYMPMITARLGQIAAEARAAGNEELAQKAQMEANRLFGMSQEVSRALGAAPEPPSKVPDHIAANLNAPAENDMRGLAEYAVRQNVSDLDVRAAIDQNGGPLADRDNLWMRYQTQKANVLMARNRAEAAKKSQTGISDLTKPKGKEFVPTNLMDEIDVSNKTANIEKIANILNASLYAGGVRSMGSIAIKEMTQNSFDALRGMLDRGEMQEGNIDVRTDMSDRTIQFTDDGSGMDPEMLGGKFLEIAGSKKEGELSSGGYGISKMVWMFGSSEIEVKSMKNGKVATLRTTGPALYDRLTNPEEFQKNNKITYRPPTTEEAKMFPKGHGTSIKIKVPEQYTNQNTGAAESIDFPYSPSSVRGLNFSPLFKNITMKFNGQEVLIGSKFPMEQFQPFNVVKFPWGTVRVYVSREEKDPSWRGNTHVLSAGVWQFDTNIELKSNKPVRREFYIDIQPAPGVVPGTMNYPIAPNREAFSGATKESFGNLFNYIGKMYAAEEWLKDIESYGDMQYVKRGEKGTVDVTKRQAIKPPKPSIDFPDMIRPEAKLEVRDDKLLIDGKEAPLLSSQDLDKFSFDPRDLIIPQDQIDNNAVMLHDGTDVIVSPAERKSLIELGREKFGSQFDEYALDIGEKFLELRNIVANLTEEAEPPMPETVQERAQREIREEQEGKKPPPSMWEQQPFDPKTAGGRPKKPWSGLSNEAIGISFDPKYYGVSTRVPFSGSFLNIGTARHKTAIGAAVAMYYTMVHEFAHHRVRSHAHNSNINNEDPDFPSEMQDILHRLNVHNDFNFIKFQQELVDIVNRHYHIFRWLDGVYNGLFPTESRGRRLTGAGQLTGNNGSNAGNVGISSLTGREGNDVRPAATGGTTGISPVHRFSGLPDPASGPAPNPNVTRESNRRAVGTDGDSGVPGVPTQPETEAARRAVDRIFAQLSRGSGSTRAGGGSRGLGGTSIGTGGSGGSGGRGGGGGGSASPAAPSGPVGGSGTPAVVQAAAAHADRINWLYKYLAGIDQLVKSNPRFTPLLRYYEKIVAMHREEAVIQDAALRVVKKWKGLPKEQGDGLTSFIDDMVNMNYRTPQEVTAGVKRVPTTAEEATWARKHNLSPDALRVYAEIKKMFDGFLIATSQNAIEEANRNFGPNSPTPDPKKLTARLDAIRNTVLEIKKQPYFPFMRFGRHYVLMKDQAGKIVHLETFEGWGPLHNQIAERKQLKRKAELARQYPQYTIEHSAFPESASPMLTLPPALLQSLQGGHTLTPNMLQAIQYMQITSARTFGRKFTNKDYMTGYSQDFMRAFSRYFFHGAKYYSQVKYGWQLRSLIAAAQAIPNDNKAAYIADYMEDHLNNTVLDPRGDFGAFRGAMFLWAMGYVPAAALQNLTQTPMITFPFLGAKFGDAKASAAIVKALTKWKNFYQRGFYDQQTEFEWKAIGYGIKTGRISETQAAELAGIAQGSTLLGTTGNMIQRNWTAFMNGASKMFELAEQVNRRVAFSAALDLALKDPNAKVVKEAITLYAEEYNELQAQGGFSEPEARAIITASHVVDQTQYVYARYARPVAFRGKKGILFVFKKYVQSTMFMLGQNPDVMLRYMLVAMLLGGAGGVPGYDDIESLVQGIGRWQFGKDWDANRATREYIINLFNGQIPPDLVLHGLSRRGFGLPALMDLIGSTYTGRPGRGLSPTEIVNGQRVYNYGKNVPMPVVDRSRAITMGQILPFDLGTMLGPERDANSVIGEQTQKASGAVFSVGFNMYKAAVDMHRPLSDPKRWERAIPRVLSSASRGFRALTEGRERMRGGVNSAPTLIQYDRNNPEEFLEALSLFAGYQPLRQQAQWDRNMARSEVEKTLTFKRTLLYEQMYEALAAKDQEEIGRVRGLIKNFNDTLPPWAKGRVITPEGLEKSMEGRARERNASESGIPSRETSIGTARHVDELYPEATIDVRRLPK